MDTTKKETVFAVVAGTAALAAIVAMPVLVASPKLLFGRSLSAIAPSLFPYVTLSLIVLLSFILCIASFTSAKWKQTPTGNEAINSQTLREVESSNEPAVFETNDAHSRNEHNWSKQAAFFLLLVGYGLLLKPVGFLISSCLVITLASLLLGNRRWLQIVLLAVIAPMCLYLIATRGMLVSLPELNPIELFYAQIIDSIRGIVSL